MRILHLSDDGLPDWRVEKSALTAKKNGHVVFFGGRLKSASHSTIFSETYPIEWTASAMLGIPYYYHCVKKQIERLAQQVRPDIVHSHNIGSAKISLDLNLPTVFDDHEYMHYYDPMTMQYNSISIPESESLVSLIDWFNHNTPSGSLLAGSKHLRGWMELDLKNRTFLFSDNITNILYSNKYAEFYLLDSNLVTQHLQNYSSALSYNNTNYSLYHLKRIE